MITPPIYIIAPLWNSWNCSQSMINSVLKNTEASLYQLILVDNGSTDGTKEGLKRFVAEHPDRLRVVTNETNKGFSGGINAGLSAIQGLDWQAVCFLNSDVVVTPNWLGRMWLMLQNSPVERAGAIGPVSNYVGGIQQVQVNYEATEASLFQFAETHARAHAGQVAQVGFLSGLCFLMKREVFDKVGYLDDRFFPGMWEDNDLCLRILAAGYHLTVDQATFIHHEGSHSFREQKVDQRETFVRGKEQFRSKWRGPDSPWEKMALERYKARGQEPAYHQEPDYAGLVKKYVVAVCRVKDGGWIIGKALERISQFADEICVLVDQHTSDNTEEVVRQFPKVTLLEKEPPHEYNEAWSRNRLLEMGASRHPDWLYLFDCDEVPGPEIIKELPYLTNPADPQVSLWTFPIIQLWNSDKTWRQDGLWGNFIQGRMYRVLPGQRINNVNNKIHCGSHPSFGWGSIGRSLVRITHYGNMQADLRKKKYEWYTKTDTDGDLNMVLGNFQDFYWQLYYGKPEAGAQPEWKVIPDDDKWGRPKYGNFFKRDLYRHVMDETSLKLIPFDDSKTASLTMLMKNEGQAMVARALRSVLPYVTEAIVIDTGTWQGEDDLAEQMGAKVYKFPWCDDFSAARNFSMSKASGEWILRIDPDEYLPKEFGAGLLQLYQDPVMDGYLWPIHNYLETPTEKGEGKWVLSETCRLYRNQPGIKFAGLVHEEIDDSLLELVKTRLVAKGVDPATFTPEMLKQETKIQRVPYFIAHFGYLRDQAFLDQKFDYYCSLGEQQIGRTPEDSRAFFNTAVHYYHTGDLEKAMIHYQENLKRDPENFMALSDVGAIFYFMGNIVEGQKWFRRALKAIGPNIHPVHKQKVEQNLQATRVRLLESLLQ